MKRNLIRLLKFKTDRPQGITSARNWLISWAIKNKFLVQTWPRLNSILIATQPQLKKHFCFVTHLDVVSAADWTEAFKPKIKQGEIIGRGTVDDKGPLAVCLEVLKLAKNENCKTSLLIIADEETENREINFILADKTFKPNFCLVADGGENRKFDIGQKGNLWISISAKTSGGHTAFSDQGENAANVLNQFIWNLQTWSQELPCQKPFTPAFINISRFEAFTEPLNFNKIAIANLQISFPPPQTEEMWINKIKRNTMIKIKVDFQSSPHLLIDEKWLKLIKSTLPGAKFITAGAPNLTHDLLLHKIPAISHCPTKKYLAHCDNESIYLADLAFGKKLYFSLVKNFSKMR